METRRRSTAVPGAIVALFGLGLVLLTRLVRPLPVDAPPLVVVLMGVLPNFGAGLALPFVIGAFEEAYRRRTGRRWRLSFMFLCFCAFMGLLAWEYAQRLFWDIDFDWNDMIASGIGVLIAMTAQRVFRLWARSAPVQSSSHQAAEQE